MKKKIVAIVLVALMAVTAGGCGNNSANESTAEAEETTGSGEENSEDELTSEAVSFPADEANTTSEQMTEENVDDFIELAEYKDLQIDAPADTVIENGMTANIDFEGSIDGEYFDGGSAEGYDLAIGSGSFIDNFEEQLIGHKAGDKVDVNVTFPEDYGQTDLAGKPALFEVTINSVSYTSADNAFAKIVDTSKVIKYPQDMVDSWKQMYVDQYSAYLPSESEEGEDAGTTDEADAADADADTEETADAESDAADAEADTEETANAEADAADVEADTEETKDAESDTADAEAAAEETAEADNKDAKAEESPEETLKKIAELFGMTEESMNEMILSTVKYCMVSRAILAKEGITRDSEYYQNCVSQLLSDYGFASIDDALAAGIPENQFYYSADSNVAIQVIKDNQAKA